MLNFPDTPISGQQFTAPNGGSWLWDGAKWTGGGPPSIAFMPLTGGQMTGALLVESPQTLPWEAVSKSYVDSLFSPAPGKNRLINGSFLVDQWNAGAQITPVQGSKACDRWACGANQAGKYTTQNSAVSCPGTTRALKLTSTSAYASGTNDFFYIYQSIENLNMTDLLGVASNSNATPATLSFWAYATVVGNYSGCVQGNLSGTSNTFRSYPFTFNITAANTWQYFAITIPVDTVGTGWLVTGTLGGLNIFFDLGCGATGRAPAGAWTTGNFVGANGGASLVATSGASLYLASIQLEAGSIATPFDRRLYGFELSLCQRYYYSGGMPIFGSGYSPNAAGLSIFCHRIFPVTMRTTPTQSGATYSNVNLNAVTIGIYPGGAYFTATNTASGAFQIAVQANSDTYSAEL